MLSDVRGVVPSFYATDVIDDGEQCVKIALDETIVRA